MALSHKRFLYQLVKKNGGGPKVQKKKRGLQCFILK
jgi:hypothetical protein